jgi:hypothetical protein
MQGNVSLRDLIEEYNLRLDELQTKLNSYPHHTSILFSDCNINLLKLNTSQLSSEYLDTSHMNGFIQTNLKATRINPTSYSLIDHIMSNNVTNDIISGTIVCDLSDHFPTFYSSKDVNNPSSKKTVMTRAFTLANKEKFRTDLRNIRWHSVTSETNVNNALDKFLDTFLTLYNLHFPVKKQKLSRDRVKIKDFMTRGLLISRRKKNQLFKKQIVSPTPHNVLAYKVYRNLYNSVLRKSKKMYYEDILRKFKSKPKKLWEILNNVNGKPAKSGKINEIFNGQNYTIDTREMAQCFNEFFAEIGPEIANSVEQSNIDPISFMPNNLNAPDFVINNTGQIHVIDVIKSMHSKSSIDCNGINMELIKFVSYEICVPLAHIFQLSIETGIFPERFKSSRIVPIFKQGDPTMCDNYRPIALVDSFSKILEKMVAIDLANHLDRNNLLFKHQYGFQRGKSTEHNLIHVTNYIGQALNDSKWCIGIFLDLKKAFDTVQHDILLRKLEKFGVRGTALRWFTTYLSNRTQCVDIDGTLSDFRRIIMSVFQGSSLGPILFLCFINDIFNCTNLDMFLFADDTNALSTHDNLNTLIDFVNNELRKLASWFKANKLVLNISKTKYMIFRTKNRAINMLNKNIFIDFNDPNSEYDNDKVVNLQRVHNNGNSNNQTYKLLGVLFDEFLSFNQHLSYIQSKIARSLFLLNRTKNFLSKNALRMLYFATVHSHLTYCPIILSIACKSQIKKLSIMQKKAIRIITGSSFNDHTAPLFLKCNILTVNDIIEYAKLNFMHSVKYGYCPKSFLDVFRKLDTENLVYELRYPNEFEVPRARIELFKRIPLFTLPTDWNNCGDLRFYVNPTTFRITLVNVLRQKFATENNLGGE